MEGKSDPRMREKPPGARIPGAKGSICGGLQVADGSESKRK